MFGECYGGEVAGDTINGYNSGSAEINGLANGSTDAGNGYIHGSAEINGLANGSTDGGAKGMSKLVKTKHDEITYRIIGAAMTVHGKMGPGYKEEHYQKAMEIALVGAGLNFEAQKQISVYFGKTQAGLLFMDLYVESAVAVELKALSHLMTKNEIAQVITYLKASGSNIGLLINFGRKYLEYKRILPPKTITDFNERDWRHVYKFKGQESKFSADQAPSGITCALR